MKKILTILLCIAHCVLCIDLSAQTIKELEAQKKKALDELAVTNRLLNETQKNKKGTEFSVPLSFILQLTHLRRKAPWEALALREAQ